MLGCKPSHIAGALVCLTVSWSAFAGDLGAPSRQAAPSVRLAQYLEPNGGEPVDFDGPGAGFGSRPGYSRGAEDEPGYAPQRRAARSSAGRGGGLDYHGFHIDLSEGGGSRNLTREIASIEHQVDLVGRVGLRMSDLQLFRSFPIRIRNGLNGGGHYDGGSFVQMGNLVTSDPRPVLLHEYMHVYHHSRLPGGFQNPDIQGFYEEALSRGLYPEGSYMLTNPGEFFAMTASCYLYGSVARAPFTREAIRTRQPDYYAYLGQLFGPPHGTHSAGSAQSRLRTRGPSSAYAPQGAFN